MFDGEWLNVKIKYVVVFYVIEDDKKIIKEIKDYTIDYDRNEMILFKNQNELKILINDHLLKNNYSGYYSSTTMRENII